MKSCVCMNMARTPEPLPRLRVGGVAKLVFPPTARNGNCFRTGPVHIAARTPEKGLFGLRAMFAKAHEVVYLTVCERARPQPVELCPARKPTTGDGGRQRDP